MQQTTQYKLNKPEADDPIAVAPLNENADKIEAALLAEAQTRAAAHQAETQARAKADTALEAKHIVLYTYAGDNSLDRFFPLGFTPTGGIYRNLYTGGLAILTPADTGHQNPILAAGGFRLYGDGARSYNAQNATFYIILFN